MTLQLKFFSILRDLVGIDEKSIETPSPITAKTIFMEQLGDKKLGERLLKATRFAINGEYVPPETFVHEGDEVAFIPPVSGG